MSKRPTIDLASITSEAAVPMAEAAQRVALPPVTPVPPSDAAPAKVEGATKTADLQPLAFKVPPAFRKRFRQHAANAALKPNALLF